MEGTQKNETNMENNIENNKDNLHDKDFLPSDFLQNMGKRTQSRFVPAGQSTQMIIGASGESDFHLLSLTQQLYQQYDMKRVFYSAYVPLNDDPELRQLEPHHLFCGNIVYIRQTGCFGIMDFRRMNS